MGQNIRKSDLKFALNAKSHDCDPEMRSLCDLSDCVLHPFCTRKIVNQRLIRKYCNWCMDGMASEIRLCPSTDCPFYKYRMGNHTNLNIKSETVSGIADFDKLKRVRIECTEALAE